MSKKTGDFYAYNIRIFDYNKEKHIIFFDYIGKKLYLCTRINRALVAK